MPWCDGFAGNPQRVPAEAERGRIRQVVARVRQQGEAVREPYRYSPRPRRR